MTRVGIGVLLAAAIAAAAFLFLREPPTPGRSPCSVSAEAARRDVEPDEPEIRSGPAGNAASRTAVGAPPGARGPFVRGHVVDRGGAPVNHAAVRLELTSPEQGPDYATAGGFDLLVPVDADGSFCVPVPLHARFIVTAEAKGFAPAAKAQVSSGDDVELVLDAPARLAGRVVHLGTRQPLAGVKLELRVPGIPYPREATTGADGAYAFDDLPSVVANVETRLAGFVIDRADVDLASGAVWREVALDPGLSVSGRVVAAESGLPLEGVRVRSFWTEPGVLTDAQGAFRITGLWPGSWNFHTRAKGRSDGAAHVVLSKDRTPEDLLISVRVSREISGVVVDQDGRPLAGATVEAGADPVVTQADGRFVVGHEYEVDADSMQIHSRVRATREGLTAVSQEVELKPEGTRDVTLRLVPADVTIAGRVQDAAGRPVEGVRVICGAEPRGRVAGTDADGRFVFERSQRADEYRLWASAPGYLETELDLQRPPQTTALETTITLAEPRRLHVTGAVVDDSGEAIPGARLEVRSGEGVIATGEAAPDGRFDIVAFQSKPEPADITASAAGYGRSGIGIDCREPVSQFTFRLCRLGRIRGRVVDAATGEAVRGAEITLKVEEGCEVWGYRGRTAETPDFSFEAPPGPFELRIDADRYARATRRIDVASQATTDVGTIELRHGGAIEGVIRRASGPSRPLAIVLASGGRSSLKWAGSTDSLGWFHLDGLAPGTWEVFGADESSRYWSSGGGQLVHLCSFGTVEVGDRTVARIDGRMAAPATLTVSSGDPSASGKPAQFSMDGPDSFLSRWRAREKKREDPYFSLSIYSIEGLPLSHSSLGVSPLFSGWWQGARFDAAIGPLPPGRYRVSLSSEGRGPVDTVVELAAGEDRKVVLALPPATPAPGK